MSRRTAAVTSQLPSITEPKPELVRTIGQPETVEDWIKSQSSPETNQGGKNISEQVAQEDPQLTYELPPAKTVELALPFGNPPSPNESRRVGMLYVKDLTTHQRYGLLCLRNGLSRAGATLKNGTPVDRPSHVIRYILEQAIDGAASS